jgi:hypothetical protein
VLDRAGVVAGGELGTPLAHPGAVHGVRVSSRLMRIAHQHALLHTLRARDAADVISKRPADRGGQRDGGDEDRGRCR